MLKRALDGKKVKGFIVWIWNFILVSAVEFIPYVSMGLASSTPNSPELGKICGVGRMITGIKYTFVVAVPYIALIIYSITSYKRGKQYVTVPIITVLWTVGYMSLILYLGNCYNSIGGFIYNLMP